ncbi:MAG TPA: hypothetical protein VHT73_18535 [Thermodesulfobacteriota bacterium]|nr:hypothetical protein [Thermodesulfobacteriota bacterium]
MRRFFISALITAGFIIGGASSFAQENQPVTAQLKQPRQMMESKVQGITGQSGIAVPGQVTSVTTEDNIKYTVQIKDKEGNEHTFTVPSSEEVQDLRKGDKVEISFQKVASGTMKKSNQ